MTRRMLEYHARNAHTEEQRQAARDELRQDFERFAHSPADNARRVEDFETPQGRAARQAWLRKRADRAYRNWRLTLVFCAACAAAIVAMIVGMAALHLFAVAAATLADPLAQNPY